MEYPKRCNILVVSIYNLQAAIFQISICSQNSRHALYVQRLETSILEAWIYFLKTFIYFQNAKRTISYKVHIHNSRNYNIKKSAK